MRTVVKKIAYADGTCEYKRTKTNTTPIHRLKPCGCGCKGTDPWHAAVFHRVIRDITEIPFEVNQTDRYSDVVTAKGRVTVPWGTVVVYRWQPTMDGKVYSPTWKFAPYNTEYDDPTP